jgi:HCOMODA/2-hydroxy-3-carboxy-muconic semialdehyde decarboxylase
LLVDSIERGRDLAAILGSKPTALMRGHGAVIAGSDIRMAVYIAYYLEVAAKLQMQATAMEEIVFLTKGEVDLIIAEAGPFTTHRTWENWCRRAGRTMSCVGPKPQSGSCSPGGAKRNPGWDSRS